MQDNSVISFSFSLKYQAFVVHTLYVICYNSQSKIQKNGSGEGVIFPHNSRKSRCQRILLFSKPFPAFSQYSVQKLIWIQNSFFLETLFFPSNLFFSMTRYINVDVKLDNFIFQMKYEIFNIKLKHQQSNLYIKGTQGNQKRNPL